MYIRFAHSKNILDIPNHRSSHTKATPRGGGIFLVIGTLVLFLSYAFAQDKLTIATPLLLACSGVAILGWIDDIRNLSSKLRLIIQLIIGILLFYCYSQSLESDLFTTNGYFLIGCTLVTVWLIGSLNIYNFMDGIDGIATLQGVVSATIWAILGYYRQSELTLMFSILILGGLVAFLIFNWSPAKIFLGDCASGFLGFSFAALPLLFTLESDCNIWISINLSALILFPFLFDGSYTLIRRLINRENILEAHRSHLYQKWVLAGTSHRKVASAYGLWALIGGTGAICVSEFDLSLPFAYLMVSLPAIALLLYSNRFKTQN